MASKIPTINTSRPNVKATPHITASPAQIDLKISSLRASECSTGLRIVELSNEYDRLLADGNALGATTIGRERAQAEKVWHKIGQELMEWEFKREMRIEEGTWGG